MPTMMSAWPSRAISSRIAGVNPRVGTTVTLPPAGLARRHGLSRLGTPLPSAARNLGLCPLGILRARDVAAVRRLEGDPPDAQDPPRTDPCIDRRLHVRPQPDEPGLRDDR